MKTAETYYVSLNSTTRETYSTGNLDLTVYQLLSTAKKLSFPPSFVFVLFRAVT